MTTWVGRLPLRRRLVLGFLVAMLVLLLVAGGFVYWRVLFALDRGLDRDIDQAISALGPPRWPAGSSTCGSTCPRGTKR